MKDQEDRKAFQHGGCDLRVAGQGKEVRRDHISKMRCGAFAIVGEDGWEVQDAAGAESPDPEAHIGGDRCGRLVRLGIEFDEEEVYGFDDGNR